MKGIFELELEIMGCKVLEGKNKSEDSDYINIQILVTINCIIQFPSIKLFEKRCLKIVESLVQQLEYV